MHTCPLLRASIQSRKVASYRQVPPTRKNVSAHRWLALSATVLELMGLHALRDVLNAIPDTNDDFGLF